MIANCPYKENAKCMITKNNPFCITIKNCPCEYNPETDYVFNKEIC